MFHGTKRKLYGQLRDFLALRLFMGRAFQHWRMTRWLRRTLYERAYDSRAARSGAEEVAAEHGVNVGWEGES